MENNHTNSTKELSQTYVAKSHRKRRKFYKSMGLCYNCGCVNTNMPHILCHECREKEQERYRKTRQERLLNNLCTICGKPRDIKGKKLCQSCKNKYLEYNRKSKSKRLNKLDGDISV